jgi:hypothetical protein
MDAETEAVAKKNETFCRHLERSVIKEIAGSNGWMNKRAADRKQRPQE